MSASIHPVHRSTAVAFVCLAFAACGGGAADGQGPGGPPGGMPPMGVEVVTLAEKPVEQSPSSSAR